MRPTSLRNNVDAAARVSRKNVAEVLARAGRCFDVQFNANLRDELIVYPNASLFLKCIVKAALWAGFVDDDSPDWPVDGVRFFETEAQHIKDKYRRGYHQNAQPGRYLETWGKLLNDRDVPRAPDAGCSAHELVRFHQDASSKLSQLDWQRERGWVGAWSFYAAFKLFLLHEDNLWHQSAVDSVVMPMGGARSRKSFEGGWAHLSTLGIVEPLTQLPTRRRFADEMALAKTAHAGVQALAALSDSRALHINSAVYLLGSEE
jgi:hypothetical protein